MTNQGVMVGFKSREVEFWCAACGRTVFGIPKRIGGRGLPEQDVCSECFAIPRTALGQLKPARAGK